MPPCMFRKNKEIGRMNKKQIWVIVVVIGLYIACQLIADIGATKFIEVAGIVMPAGTFVFALTFTLRDIIHKRLGKDWAQAAIVTAAVCNILLSGYLWIMAKLPAPEWFGLADGWNAIFAIIPAITIGSIAAEMVSELVDTEIYHLWTNKFPEAPQWSRVLVSNFVSIPIDSLVFSVLAFSLLPIVFGGDVMPLWLALGRVASGQVLYKAIVTIASLPGIYLVKEK